MQSKFERYKNVWKHIFSFSFWLNYFEILVFSIFKYSLIQDLYTLLGSLESFITVLSDAAPILKMIFGQQTVWIACTSVNSARFSLTTWCQPSFTCQYQTEITSSSRCSVLMSPNYCSKSQPYKPNSKPNQKERIIFYFLRSLISNIQCENKSRKYVENFRKIN